MTIRIAQPEIGDEEIRAVNEVMNSGMLAQGPKVAQLENDFAKYCGTKYALAVSSGTVAIHTALHVAGIRKGDEVITVPFSFVATINPILMVGAKPVLVDIDSVTFCMDVRKLDRAITPKTKAIMPVHLYGQIADMDEIIKIAKKHNLIIIEDACQAVGADYKGHKAGGFGNLGCFSLYATKNMMSGEGGIITTNDEKLAKYIKKFRQHGMSDPYMYDEVGYNYRLTDLQGAIAVEQLKKVDRFNNARQKNAELLNKGLSGIEGLITPKIALGRNHVFHQYTIRITSDYPMSRDEFVKSLQAKEIGTGIYYPKALHEYPHIAKLGYKLGDFPESEKAAREVVSLPVHPNVTTKDIATIINYIKELANAK
jgi:dTDP-4-amino-4,6-dideoxygalactose transaminase